MIKKILIGLGVIVGGILLFAAVKSPEMNVSREIVISAAPEALFPYINSAKKSYDWMPWAESDPSVEIKYSGPDEGVGATSSWKGKEMGVGTSEVVESVANQVVKTKLTYTEPFAMSQLAEVSLTPISGGTLVKWSVSGHSNYFFRLMGIFVNCDDMIGKEFEKGLNKLKTLTENK
ncbi:MAG: hypothetical protein A4S09_17050 [Proteobacteria bacterium SG_bin7]|nr:MAG: hypothetical protein A4S09_17050 [Proteobacteria bacterium SG_bin7]